MVDKLIEKFRWLAGAIAAHPDQQIAGRIRLQKTIKLLQRLDFPTDYSYTLIFTVLIVKGSKLKSTFWKVSI